MVVSSHVVPSSQSRQQCWFGRRRTWSITFFRRYRCGNECCRCPNGCATFFSATRSCKARFCAFSCPWWNATCATIAPLAPPPHGSGRSTSSTGSAQAQTSTSICRDDTAEMRAWAHNGGFSVDGSVCIEGTDRIGLERLPRYRARPPFAQDHLRQRDAEHLVYRNPKPAHGTAPGARSAALVLTPLELIAKIAALVPPPRAHRHRYDGVLAPDARLRAAVTAQAPAAVASAPVLRRPAKSPAIVLWPGLRGDRWKRPDAQITPLRQARHLANVK